MDFRSIWVGFGKGFGGVRENFGAFFRNFFNIFSNFFGTCFALRFNLACKGLAYFVQVFLCQDPRAVSRSLAERLNARGSPTSACEIISS